MLLLLPMLKPRYSIARGQKYGGRCPCAHSEHLAMWNLSTFFIKIPISGWMSANR